MAQWIRNIAASLTATLALVTSARAAVAAPAPEPAKEAVEFFENKVRPVLVERCYKCHDGSGAQAVKGGFTLDTRDGLLKGGESGKPAIVPGDPAASRIIHAIKWTDEQFRMPPKEEHRLTAAQVADLEAWVKMGAPDPRAGTAAGAAGSAKPASGKEHWAYVAPKEHPAPDVKDKGWV